MGGYPKIRTASGAMANILVSDVRACGAVVHVIDAVLLATPAAPVLASPIAAAAPVQAAVAPMMAAMAPVLAPLVPAAIAPAVVGGRR